ncbi:hypothetical protein SCATT_p10680 (plasmid) [Streptantibioticus cattleyicolor NRRL 8057 = DSM 46488]|uniref:Uncharacterized protein n=1 Tax=Streptantibioticus cattleyicolor (strain ATCC 35852 / DSM 46488 / JCM 4925 / NBRC 14057 / NRRL 8057) TaxID=1003195 RepID=G8XEA8_STREN|nr:hypothetical protein SCATT_p10680 [Streptantibioticus cattleyicolor NRRL 8057 = DSM 46488]
MAPSSDVDNTALRHQDPARAAQRDRRRIAYLPERARPGRRRDQAPTPRAVPIPAKVPAPAGTTHPVRGVLA